jgi:hypothetical protein
MRAIVVAAFIGLATTAASAHAETIKLHCVVPSAPKAEAEDYVVDTEDNTVTVILYDMRRNVLSSKTYAAKISPDSIEWTVETPGKLIWTQRYDRASGKLTSSNTAGDSLIETCKVAQ